MTMVASEAMRSFHMDIRDEALRSLLTWMDAREEGLGVGHREKYGTLREGCVHDPGPAD